MLKLVSVAAPHLVKHCFMDRDWVWICNINLSGEANRATRDKLKEIGFKFSVEGHTMPDGKSIGRWGNSCLRPMPPRRRGGGGGAAYDQRGRGNNAAQAEDEDRARTLAELRAMGL